MMSVENHVQFEISPNHPSDEEIIRLWRRKRYRYISTTSLKVAGLIGLTILTAPTFFGLMIPIDHYFVGGGSNTTANWKNYFRKRVVRHDIDSFKEKLRNRSFSCNFKEYEKHYWMIRRRLSIWRYYGIISNHTYQKLKDNKLNPLHRLCFSIFTNFQPSDRDTGRAIISKFKRLNRIVFSIPNPF